MTFSLASASVSMAASVATYNIATRHTKNETSAGAINIGNLTEQSSVVSISDQGSTAGNAVSSTFTASAGDLTNLGESFTYLVDQYDTHYQLFDSSGNIVADNQGTAAQQAAYGQWVGSGLALSSADTYTAVATPQADVALTASTTQNQGTSLQVSSQLTGSDASEYYNFNLTAGNNIKLAFDAGSQNPSTRVQIYNSSGGLVADSAGNAFQKANYQALTSGTGLTASVGSYSIKVSYADNIDPTSKNINYSFQLYSGSSYAVLYKNKVTAQPTDISAIGSVNATSTARLYSRQAYNTINEKAASAVNIGWLAQDKSALQVYSQLTPADNAEQYSFTLQSGDNLKFGFDTSSTSKTTNASALRVQLYDGSGSRVIADSEGTTAQRAAYKSLTTTNGLKTSAGNYIVKVSYAQNATKSNSTYTFDILSGTSYAALYKTLASPQTYGNALLNGNVTGYAAAAGAASYLTALSNGSTPDVISALQA